MPWLERIQSEGLETSSTSLEIDYARYGTGEARLAWLDEELLLRFPARQGRLLLQQILRRVTEEIASHGAGIGHLKLFLIDGVNGVKISIPTFEEPGSIERIPEITGTEVTLLVNARVEMPACELRDLLQQVVAASGVEYTVKREAAFHPKEPNPTHRL
jgi:hypothetical protein